MILLKVLKYKQNASRQQCLEALENKCLSDCPMSVYVFIQKSHFILILFQYRRHYGLLSYFLALYQTIAVQHT